MSLLLFFAAIASGYWACMGFSLWRAWRSVPLVSQLARRDLPAWPLVSFIIPARNEARTVVEAVRSKLRQRYPRLELMLVNDRSTDDTGPMMDTLAAEDSRVRVAHLTELPDGWLGKVHALDRGVALAAGEWLLFSDADVHLSEDTLSRCIAYAESKQIDHVAVLPQVTPSGSLLQCTLVSFFRIVCAGARLASVPDPRSSASIGVGAFNLVRRSALERSPGLSWLKLEVGDDAAFGLMLKASGARQAVLNGRGEVTLEFYSSFKEFIRAMERNGATAAFPVLCLALLTVMALECSPLLLTLAAAPFSLPLAAVLWMVAALLTHRNARWLGLPTWPAWVPFAGMVPLGYALLRSAALALVRGGIVWRETKYPTSVIRAGRRLKLGGRPASAPATTPSGRPTRLKGIALRHKCLHMSFSGRTKGRF